MPIARDRIVLQTDVSIAASTNLSVVTGLSFPVLAGTRYAFRVRLVVTGTASVGFAPAISASPTTAATFFASQFVAATGAGSLGGGGTSTYAATGAAAGAAGTITPTASLVAAAGSYGLLEGEVLPAASQILQVEVQPETATAMVVKAGSYIEYETL